MTPAPLQPFGLAWFAGTRVQPQLQAESAECGLACLAMIASYHGYATSIGELRGRFGSSSRGMTLADLINIGGELRFSSRPVKLSLDNLGRLRLPAVLHWDLDHFVVLTRVRKASVTIVDPAVGERRIGMEECSGHFTGVALEMQPSPQFARKRSVPRLRFRDFMARTGGLGRPLATLFLMSLALQVLALALPIMTQLVVDQAIVHGDHDLLLVLGCAFGALAVTQAGIGFARTLGVLHFGAHLKFAWGARLFHHLIRLPLAYFERRQVGDILSRFNSLGTIQSLVTTTVVEAVLDGLLAITTLVVMYLYSPSLAAISVCAVLVILAMRLLVYPWHRDATHGGILDGAREDSYLLESLRGVLTIKSFGLEAQREAGWQGRAAREIRSGVAANLFPSSERIAGQLIMAIENILIVCLGAALVMNRELSVGMLIAFIAYKAQFTSRAAGFIDRMMEFRMASVHAERISDIALEPEEFIEQPEGMTAMEVQGALELRDVSFRYGATDPLVLDSCNVSVAAGECVVITSPSGTGKTTLMKVMMGLLPPSSGKVLVDGVELRGTAVRSYRGQIAAVMQEDTLLGGSIAENISLFDPALDMARVQQVARLAAVHDVICALPMRYSSPVGDMGAALSGGQRQRILLARALYQRPRILFLDEATANLDVAAEAEIHRSLSQLGITRIVISHRPSTMQIADRVIDIREAQRGATVAARPQAPRIIPSMEMHA